MGIVRAHGLWFSDIFCDTHYHNFLKLLLSSGHCRCALEVTNFSTSWSDGKAFCAVIYDYNADDFKYQDALGKEPDERLERAFQFAEEIVGVERLLDVEGNEYIVIIIIIIVIYDIVCVL